jgi:5-aminopentanamidase
LKPKKQSLNKFKWSNLMKLAALQAPSPAGDMDMAFDTLAWALHAAGAAGASMLTAPEVWMQGYNQNNIAHLALTRGDEWQRRISALCQKTRCALTVGYAESSNGAVYNSALVINDQGQDIAHYRKLQLYGPREKSLYLAGNAYCTFELEGQKAAVLICYDVEFSPHLAALTSNYTVPAMAANHCVSIVYANFCGVEGNLTYIGGSLIAGRDGAVLAQAGTCPSLLVAELPSFSSAVLSTQATDFRKVL